MWWSGRAGRAGRHATSQTTESESTTTVAVAGELAHHLSNLTVGIPDGIPAARAYA